MSDKQIWDVVDTNVTHVSGYGLYFAVGRSGSYSASESYPGHGLATMIPASPSESWVGGSPLQ